MSNVSCAYCQVTSPTVTVTDMTSNNASNVSDITEIRDMTSHYRDNVSLVAIIMATTVLFLTSILINVTIVVIHIKTPALKTISNRSVKLNINTLMVYNECKEIIYSKVTKY